MAIQYSSAYPSHPASRPADLTLSERGCTVHAASFWLSLHVREAVSFFRLAGKSICAATWAVIHMQYSPSSLETEELPRLCPVRMSGHTVAELDWVLLGYKRDVG